MTSNGMHPIIAGMMAVGVALFVVGLGMVLVVHSEAEEMIRSDVAGLEARLYSLNERAAKCIYLTAIGAGVTVFALLIDENRRNKEREKDRGFFY